MNAWPSKRLQGWFVVAQSGQVRAKPWPVMLMGQPVVLARLPSGGLTALEDRCPHRQYPLSAGRITEAGLQCGYHGWTFGADGRCTRQPGLPEGRCPPAVGVPTVDVMEHDGLIWLRSRHADAPLLAPAPLPDFIRSRPAGTLRFMQRMQWQGDALDALENFMDPLHTHLTHPGLVRRDGGRRAVTATPSWDEHGMTVTYEGGEEQNGLLYRLFESPRLLERAHHGVAAPGSACIEYRYRNGSALFFTLHFTPLEAWKTLVHASLHVEGRWAPAWAVRLFAWPFLRRVARQDQEAVERQARNRQRFRPRHDASTELDIVSTYLRGIWHEQPVPAVTASPVQPIVLML
ncbi:Rieske 2Fe-2S domain-containing protein [Roseateles amylovorans]|uniref:Rieske 2Fe-2S domain-containing protein n=1 Tax=Roseateles amylovorans TaxID=2978473 RepID=A0ABY6AXA0_9BURK|nr:Rieske 2Fe-2S domain-containing protein [Roseateles amylovorans]UXH77801.1 Rieske 2Fe-2S domain-containing protein [Roseateles amylovorans]